MIDVIKKYLSSGLSIIPVKADKRPLIEWKQYQSTIATEEVESWTLPIACVCGAVSGGLICIDFDDKGSAFAEWGKRVKEIIPTIKESLYIQQTPSGGFHVVFKSDYKIENKKLAQKKNGKITVLIETRGEGGYFLVAPSSGYVSKSGDITTLKKISEHDAETMILIGESMNEYVQEKTETASKTNKNDITPFDDYDLKHDPVDLLLSHGWSIVGKRADKVMLCRPDKKQSLSATWNHIPGRFYVFSTSTEFEAQHIYKPSAVYAILNYRGDYVSAAKQLYKDGYGSRHELKPVDIDTTHRTITVKASSFKENIYKYYKGNHEKGMRLGLNYFDKFIRFEKGYLNVITGIPTHGKSEFTDFIMTTLAEKHKWNFVVFSPENYPLEIHFNKIAEKYHKTMLWGKEDNYIVEAIDFIDQHFDFINATEEELSLESILSACIDIKATRRVDGLIIDPWNEIEQASRPAGMNDSEFTGICLRKLRKFARKNEICLFVVVHPTKMYKDKNTEDYPVPTLYDISGSANWYNKTDNGIIVYRNFAEGKESTDVYIKKIKYRNYGQLGMVRFNYLKDKGTYEESNIQSDFFGSVK